MMEKRKVLFLIHTLGGGGAEKALVNLVKALPSNRWDITVETVIDTGRYRRELPSYIEYRSMISLPMLSNQEKKNDSGSLLATRSPFKLMLVKAYTLFWRVMPAKLLYRWASGSRHYDNVIAYLEGITTKIVSGCDDSTTHKAAWVHVDLSIQEKAHAVYHSQADELAAYDRFDRIVCVSDYVAETFTAMFGRVSEKVTVCHNILDADEVSELSYLDSQIARRDQDVVNVVSVGRLNWQKGYDRLLEAIASVKSRGVANFHVDIIGTGTAREQLEEQLHGLYLEDNVNFIGYLDNPYPYIAHADLFVAPSRTEGLSTVVAEAIALGCPVLATDCSGMRELLGESNAGLIVPNTVEGIADGLTVLLGNTDELVTLGARAKLAGNPLTASRGVREFEEAVSDR